jgi:hypothetical protein
MRAQIDFAHSPDFQRFVENLGSLEDAQNIIHGIFIELHPRWRAAYDHDRLVNAGFSPGFDLAIDIWQALDGPALGHYDASQAPERWSAHSQGRPPFLVKIYVVPTIDSRIHLRDRVERYANSQPFYCVVIDAPIPTFVAQVNAAADIQATHAGTMGGFLKDKSSGDIFGVTCAHVAQVQGSSVILQARRAPR